MVLWGDELIPLLVSEKSPYQTDVSYSLLDCNGEDSAVYICVYGPSFTE